MRTVTRSSLGMVASIGLAACSFGDNGSTNVSLKSEADIIREVGNVIALAGGIASGTGGASANARQPGVRALIEANSAYSRRDTGVTPKAGETFECNGGGSYAQEDFAGVAYDLPFFGVSPTMDYSIRQNDHCRTIMSDTRYTFEIGADRFGDNGAYAGTPTADNPYYEFGQSGNGNTPYTLTVEDTSFDEKIVLRKLGRGERRDDGLSNEVRESLRAAVDLYFNNEHLALDLTAGEDGVPLVIVDGYAAGTAAVDGVLRYSSPFCDGGRVEYTTVQKLSVVTDEFGQRYISGGQLVIRSGHATAAVVFLPNGDIQYEFGNGAAGVIARGSLIGACVFTP